MRSIDAKHNKNSFELEDKANKQEFQIWHFKYVSDLTEVANVKKEPRV